MTCQLGEDLSEAEYADIIRQKGSFSTWFHRWDSAFCDFLTRESTSLSTIDSSTASLLQLHQKAAFVVSSIEYGQGEAVWRGFDTDFKDIVYLATEVFRIGQKRAIAYQPPENVSNVAKPSLDV